MYMCVCVCVCVCVYTQILSVKSPLGGLQGLCKSPLGNHTDWFIILVKIEISVAVFKYYLHEY